MNALDIWYECVQRKIALSRNGDFLHYEGASTAVDPIFPTMQLYRDSLLECVAALDGAPLADGPYLPWNPYIAPDKLIEWRRELFEAVDELASLEGWKPDDYDHTIMCIERQPASTLRPDLAHFIERLTLAKAEAAARDAAEKPHPRPDA